MSRCRSWGGGQGEEGTEHVTTFRVGVSHECMAAAWMHNSALACISDTSACLRSVV